MSQYDDLYIRMSLDDIGTIPRAITGGVSPDVIPYGKDTVVDPQAFFSGNFDQYVSKDLLVGEANNIYVRLVNYFEGEQTGKVFLYFALNSQLNDPKTWKLNKIKTADAKTSIDVSADEGGIAVTAVPFVWTPTKAAPTGDNYNLIAQIVTVANPNPIPTTIAAFSTYVGNNGGIGWQTPTLPPPVTRQMWSTTVPYSQGDVERTMDFMLDCKNIVVGSTVELTCDNPGTIPPISIPVSIVNSLTFSIGVEVIAPVGFKCNLTFTLKSPAGQTQPAGSYVKLSASYLDTTNSGPSKRIVVMTSRTTN